MIEIIKIIPGSMAESAGMKTGDQIVQINGKNINDPLDFSFYIADRRIEVLVNRNDSYILFDLEKDDHEDLGCEFREMKIKSCSNHCIFCFVHQNPKGLRRTLYLKDEDYRFSFLYGNYVTLTNIKETELQRIVDQRLSPLYISVHATDVECRKKLLGINFDDQLLEKMEYLVKRGIELHTQIVICPGINDGDILIKSVKDLSRFYPGVKSVAIVPVGLTKFREKLIPLRLLMDREWKEMIKITDNLRKEYKKMLGTGFIYLADEFFLQANLSIPAGKYYDDFYQLENGVGELRYTIDNFNSDFKKLPGSLTEPYQITWVTGTLAASSIDRFIISKLNLIKGLNINMMVIENDFYGPSVSVSGLLVGYDIYHQLKGKVLGNLVLLPPRVVNDDNLFLDGWSLNSLEEKLHVRCQVFIEPFADLLKIISELQNHREKKILII
jgi:putative radical SAM enzyme (TIGR03279 family)